MKAQKNVVAVKAVQASKAFSLNYDVKAMNISGAKNAPALNEVSKAMQSIAALVGTEPRGILTPLGHKGGMGGAVDYACLTGRAHTVNDLVRAIANSSCTGVTNIIQKQGGLNDTALSCIAHRAYEHINWCADEHNMKHGGLLSRLAKVGQTANHKAIADCFKVLADAINMAYKINHSKLYNKRAKYISL